MPCTGHRHWPLAAFQRFFHRDVHGICGQFTASGFPSALMRSGGQERRGLSSYIGMNRLLTDLSTFHGVSAQLAAFFWSVIDQIAVAHAGQGMQRVFHSLSTPCCTESVWKKWQVIEIDQKISMSLKARSGAACSGGSTVCPQVGPRKTGVRRAGSPRAGCRCPPRPLVEGPRRAKSSDRRIRPPSPRGYPPPVPAPGPARCPRST